MIKLDVVVHTFINISMKSILVVSAFCLSACSMSANIAELLALVDPPQIQVGSPAHVTSDNQSSYILTGVCVAEMTSFTITSPQPERLITCNSGAWSVVLDLSSESDGPLKLVTDKVDPRTGQKIEIEVQKDTTPPTLTNLVVAAGQAITNQSSIGYVVSGVDIAQVYVTEDNTCETGGSWQSAIATVPVSNGDGNKDFYAKARDAVGNVSACAVTTSITLDQTVPIVTGLSDDLIVKANKSWNWSCTDLHGPCEYSYIISQSNILDPLAVFSATNSASQSSGDGYYYVAVQARDLAGNVSTVRRVQVNLSSNLPSLSIEGGTPYHNSSSASLSLSNLGDFDTLEITNGSACTMMSSVSAQAVVVWSLTAGDGSKEVSYRFKNSNNNEETGCFISSIIVDTTAPVLTGLSSDAVVKNDKTWNWGCTDVTTCLYRFVIDQNAATNPTGTYGSLTTTSLNNGDGTYFLHVQARDQLGNESTVVHVSVVLDNTLPVISGLSTDLTPVQSKMWSWSCTDAQVCQSRFVVDQVATTLPTGSYSSTMTVTQGSGDGNYYIHVQLRDAAGNESLVAHYQAVLDNTGPVITGLVDDSAYYQSKNFSWSCTDTYGPCTYRYLIDQTAVSTPSSSYSTNTTATHSSGNGDYYLHVQARDVAGNEALTHTSFKLDNTSPSVTLSSTAAPTTNVNPIVVTAVFSEDVTGLTAADFSVVNGIAGNLTGTGSSYSVEITPAGEGTVSVSLPMDAAIDRAANGNSASTTLSRVYDSTIPTVSLTTALGANTNTSPLVFTATFSESVSTFSASSLTVTNGTAAVTGSGPYTVSVAANSTGAVSVQVNADSVQDTSGNLNSASSVVSVLYDNVAPSLPTMTVGASYTTTTSAPSLSWTESTDTHSGVLRYEVAIGTTSGGSETSSFVSVGTSTNNTTHGMTFIAGTLYYPSVRVRDNAGNVSSIVTGSAFRYLVTPTLTTVSPASGPIAGGTTITLSGTHFYSPMTVTVGGIACTSVSVVSSTSLTCVTPAGSVGDVDVVVSNQASQSVTKTAGYKYTKFDNIWASPLASGFPVTNYNIQESFARWMGSNLYYYSTSFYNVTTHAWTVTNASGRPPGIEHAPVTAWTGARLIVWGGLTSSVTVHGTGAMLDPLTNTWTAMTTTGAPAGRYSASSVWTGSKLFIWGGCVSSDYITGCVGMTNTGALYDPVANSWSALPTAGAPSARANSMITYYDNKVYIWTGWSDSFGLCEHPNGGIFDLATNTWSAMSTTNAPIARCLSAKLVKDNKFVIWGGQDTSGNTGYNSGSIYDVTTQTWQAMTTTNAPAARINGGAFHLNDGKVFVWGGSQASGGYASSGGLYDIASGTWTTVNNTGAPSARTSAGSGWTGSKYVIWGGMDNSAAAVGNGGIYDPTSNTWTAVSTSGALSARFSPIMIWTGSAFLIGAGQSNYSTNLTNGALLK